MRFTSPSRTIPSICLAIYGCGQLDRVADFINNSGEYVEDGVTFTPGMIAGQYAFEQVKLDRKGYDTRRLQKYLSFLADAGAFFSEEEALQRADDLINNFTADFGHDEDGDATFRIKAQSYRLKKYDCHALWSMINQASLTIESVKPETFCDEDSDEDISSDSLDLVLTSRLFNKQNEAFATLTQYYTVSEGMLTVEDLIIHFLTTLISMTRAVKPTISWKTLLSATTPNALRSLWITSETRIKSFRMSSAQRKLPP